MKSHWMIPIAALTGGFAAFVLRMIQNRTGFSDGLPVPGTPAARALLVLLLVVCAALFVFSRSLTGGTALPPPADSHAFLLLPAMGCFLFLAAGALDVYEGLTGENLMDAFRLSEAEYLPVILYQSSQEAQVAALLQTICGVLCLGGAAGALCFLSQFRPRHPRAGHAFRNELLLLLPVSLVARLVVLYRKECVNPVVQEYVIGLAALMLLSTALFSLISFQFRQGSRKQLAFFGGCASVFCLCSLADSPEWLSTDLLNLGGPLLLMGFLPLFLWRGEEAPASGTVSSDTV